MYGSNSHNAAVYGGNPHRSSIVPKNSPHFRPPDHYRHRSPGPPLLLPTDIYDRHNFVIELLSDQKGFKKGEVTDLIQKCESKPDDFFAYSAGFVSGRLCYLQWTDTLSALVSLWELRFDGAHQFTPKLTSSLALPSDYDELSGKLKSLFVSRVRQILDGESVKKWERKLHVVLDEIEKISSTLKKPHRLCFVYDLQKKTEGLKVEKDLIEKRIMEFKSAMNCILAHLERLGSQDFGAEEIEVFKFSDVENWSRIHYLIMRECRRFDDGLPIYAFRQEILYQIHSQQIMVLIGETGSGKSTQVVQLLADSGVAACESIVCTQPRKIAAISLAHRVGEESRGCYENNSVVCCPLYATAQCSYSKITYMTDHCLLQHYMNDKDLTGISCIVVDEAHERSLNTDLLLAMVKGLLCRRPDLRLIIMSATADANQLSDYFFGCQTFHVMGRNFPVEIKYVSYVAEVACASPKPSNAAVASYVNDVVRMTIEIHRTEGEGAILAFLTSQAEVEWACDNFKSPSAKVLPLHGKLSFEEQFLVFQDYPGKRKIIFATNVAETSLTIQGVKYVVDSGMVKESKFEPGSGMNILKVCRISKSSANQRAGRAGRTAPGICYRLYSEDDFAMMPIQQEPEIRRVHLGIAVLRILALGIKNARDFDFVDAPSAKAIEIAIRNLIQLGAVKLENNALELTDDGRLLVRLGIEPKLGRLIIDCYHSRLGKEGVVLAAVTANASSIFCRVGNFDDKLKSDRLKVQFCHSNGDLFTLLSVYREWESNPPEKRNNWCWENSINAKSMRRCKETVLELENCLKSELHVIITSYWLWNPHVPSDYDRILKRAILSSFSENVAMYSGYDQLGYEVALTGQHVLLHPSCSLLMFGQKPTWVVFGELLSVANPYLVCVTAFDFESLSSLCPPPLFDALKMEGRKLAVKILTGFGGTFLKKFCGKSNNNLLRLVTRIQNDCMDERIGIEVSVDDNEIRIFGPSQDLDEVVGFVNNVLAFERKWLQNECLEKCLYLGGSGVSPPTALFGVGAEIRHLELERRCLIVDVFHADAGNVDDKELLMLFEKHASGVCSVHKFTGGGQDSEDKEKWGRITFLTPDAASKAAELNGAEFNGSVLRVVPSQSFFRSDRRMFSFPAVKARVCWPRRPSRGFGVIKCESQDRDFMLGRLCNLVIGGKLVRCEVSRKYMDSMVINGLDRETSEEEVLEVLRGVTNRKILDFFLVRGEAVENLPCAVYEEALLKELSPFMPKRSPQSNICTVQVFHPEPKDTYMRALFTFDGRLHLEAAKALQELEGKVLPGCLPWQKVKCQQLFHSIVSCSAPVYFVIKTELDILLARFRCRKGAECTLRRNENGSFHVKISANATRTVAELRGPLEQLMQGKILDSSSLTPTILQHLFNRDGIMLMKSLQRETGTYILFDRHSLNVRIFGPEGKVAAAGKKLEEALLSLHENNQLEIHLRGNGQPPDLMKEVVKKFGPDLEGLKEKVPEADFSLNTRRHIISIHGTKEMKQKVQDMIDEIAQSSGQMAEKHDDEAACPICLCEVDDGYRLEACGHVFCRVCLLEQCESSIKSQDSFPICCASEKCRVPIFLTDFRSLLPGDKLEEVFRSALGAFIARSEGTFRFCPSPDCPSVYKVADSGAAGEPFFCGACHVETCTRCHLECHPYLSCEKYREFKDDPDSSLKDWCKDKDNVRDCPVCGHVIEKIDGCNHIECRCGRHICWVCLDYFKTSDDCYSHLRSIHQAIA
ncbi:Helicase-associated domain [Dillenia turbinata]|uniref:RNA helicase n=1 Tax=Dillenia turbinata TaxID=194707 RepID=A0AAN8V6S1_9MAGN